MPILQLPLELIVLFGIHSVMFGVSGIAFDLVASIFLARHCEVNVGGRARERVKSLLLARKILYAKFRN